MRPNDEVHAMSVRLVELAPLHPARRFGRRWALHFAHGDTAYFADFDRALAFIEQERLNLIRDGPS